MRDTIGNDWPDLYYSLFVEIGWIIFESIGEYSWGLN